MCAGVGAALVVLAGAAWPGAAGAVSSASTATPSSTTAAVKLSATPLGLDIAPWINPTTLSDILPLLKAAGINQLHYGGGGTADQYDWENDLVINDCADQAPTSFALTCANSDPLDFTDFSADARSIGAQTFATANYGTGEPGWAADWVKQSLTAGDQVAQWSIGNESYGCWEDDWWLTQAPLDDTDYVPNQTGCPWATEATQADGVTSMAQSYAANALPYMEQMTEAAQTAGQTVDIGIPWAFDGTVGGAGVPDNTSWDSTILSDDAQYIDFVEAHWYPYSFGGDTGGANPTAQAVIQSVQTIPNQYAKMAAIISKSDPKATVTIGETGVSYLATNVPCTPTGALFSAGDVLEWLSSGAKTVDWWPMDTGANLGSACTNLEEAMFTSNGTPDTVYDGYLLASQLAQPNAELSSLATSNGNVLAFQSVLPDGQTVVALINTNTGSSEKVTAGTSLTGTVSTESYSAGDQNASNSLIVDGTTTASAVAGGVTLPAESILVLKSHTPSKITLGATGTTATSETVKPGTAVTLTGKLTLNGVAAPAGVAVKVYRRVSGSSVNSATLTATTSATGAFTVTNTPPGYGNYSYVADYAGTSVYATATSSYPVHVTALKPTLKLTVSAKTVKPGKTVTVTATLGAWHANRTLTIYAQIQGGGKKMMKRATVNSKGQISIVYTIRVNTTFTVTFAGDVWYTPASATVIVKA